MKRERGYRNCSFFLYLCITTLNSMWNFLRERANGACVDSLCSCVLAAKLCSSTRNKIERNWMCSMLGLTAVSPLVSSVYLGIEKWQRESMWESEFVSRAAAGIGSIHTSTQWWKGEKTLSHTCNLLRVQCAYFASFIPSIRRRRRVRYYFSMHLARL